MSTVEDTPGFLFFFDYVDPISFLLDRELELAVADDPAALPKRVPLELQPPPQALLDVEGDWWRARWSEALEASAARALELRAPTLVPWTRKAHELVAHAADHGVGLKAHKAVFEAFFLEGRDIGRIDVLVGMAKDLGLDPTETKAVLDVDRHSDAITQARALADGAGIQAPPALVGRGATLEGFHPGDAVRTFLLR